MAKVDAGLRAQFREIAREIINRDRQARALGVSQNTIGEIERALVKAYLKGRSGEPQLARDNDEDEFVDWIRLPPRAREALSSLLPYYRTLGEAAQAARYERLIEDGRPRWREVDAETGAPKHGDYTIANGGVAPLVKLGLLAAVTEDGSLLGLTERGLRTVHEYNRRSAVDDPTLPKISLRPDGFRRR
jgi:hypothetical protein